MIVSWEWLSQYVPLEMSHDELVDRLTMSGLNHEGTDKIGEDQAIDLEVTSNRPDCLGHLGVAREISVLFDVPLTISDPKPPASGDAISNQCSIEIETESCYRYTARLIKGVKVGPSPDWLVKRLQSVIYSKKDGEVEPYQPINNIADITNYVMFECGQPLHAFDFGKIAGNKIVVREPKENESIEAIDHKTYPLTKGMCLICDAEKPVCIGGVMGGAESEVSEQTTDVLIEAAYFNQLSVRNTARSLNLHSPSSFRFERDIDSHQLDWASRRCCELILQVAGGELCEGVLDVGQQPVQPNPVVLRLSQLERVLGIKIPDDFVPKALVDLGLQIESQDAAKIVSIPPSWRKDLTREIDLVEEVGRVYGFDKVPDDARVPMAASHRRPADRVIDKVRDVLTGAGFDEALTPSFVPEKWSNAFSPWTENSPLVSTQPMLGVLEKASQNIGAVEFIRRSLVPSLVEAKRINEYRSNKVVELFETAKVYLPNGDSEIPDQPTMLGLVSGRDFYQVKGVVDALVQRLNPNALISLKPCEVDFLDVNFSGELHVSCSGESGERLGFIGKVSESGKKLFGLRTDAIVAELDLDSLQRIAVLIPQHVDQSPFPPVSRDFNFIVDESIRWAELECTVRSAGGDLLEDVQYLETFRKQEADGADKKRVLLSVTLRSQTETLTGEMAEKVSQQIIQDCQQKHSAKLLS